MAQTSPYRERSSLHATTHFLIASVSFLLIMALLAISRRRRRNLPPGPRGLPLLGNLPILGPNLHRRLRDLSRTYGPIMHLRLGFRLWIVVSSPAIAKEVYTTSDAALSNHEQTVATTVISYGSSSLVRCPYGQTWRMLRRVFVYELMNVRVLDAAIELRRQALKRAAVEIRARSGTVIDVGELAFDVMLSVMMSMTFGDEKSMQWRGDGGEFRRVIAEVVELLGKPNLSDYLPVLSWFDLQGIGKKMKKRVAKLDGLYEAMIEKRLRLMKCKVSGADDEGGDRQEENDLLTRLLKLGDKEKPNSVQLTNAQLKSFLMELVVGGTAGAWSTIEWLMEEVLQRPEILRRAIEELDTVVGHDRAVQETDIPRLPYLRCLLKETLRHHAVIPLLVPRVAIRPCNVAGYLIPAGARVVTNVWAIHNDPQVWDEPHEFRPERFMAGEGGSAGEFGFFPFGAGRRKCAGLPLAERTLPLVVATFLHLFDWRLADGERPDLTERSGVTLTKKKPLRAVAVPRFMSCIEFYE